MCKVKSAAMFAVMLAMVATLGCSDYKEEERRDARDARDPQGRTVAERLDADAEAAAQRFREADPSMERFFDTAYGYAIFPEVTEGGAGVGGAHGEGVVVEQGRVVGYATLSKGTIGLQLGGQKYREIIFFQHQSALDQLKRSNMEFSAQASAVAASHGASANADYANGVAVFTDTIGGLMAQAAVGGQKFRYTPR